MIEDWDFELILKETLISNKFENAVWGVLSVDLECGIDCYRIK